MAINIRLEPCSWMIEGKNQIPSTAFEFTLVNNAAATTRHLPHAEQMADIFG
jgi:hypothetical protein